MQEDLALLLDEYVSGELDADAAETLATRLATDARLRILFRAHCQIHYGLTRLAVGRTMDLPLWPGVRQRLTATSHTQFRQAVMQHIRRPRIWPRVAASLAVAALLILSVWMVWGGKPADPHIAERDGDVRITDASGAAVDDDDVLIAGNSLHVADQAMAALHLPGDRGSVRLTGPAQVTRADASTQFTLLHGQADCDIFPGLESFAMLTPHAEVRVLGTRFSVHANAIGTRVAVTKGRVAVNQAGAEGRWEVGRGEALLLSAFAAAVATDADRQDWGGHEILPQYRRQYQESGMLLQKADIDTTRLLFKIDTRQHKPQLQELADPAGMPASMQEREAGLLIQSQVDNPVEALWSLPPMPDSFALRLRMKYPTSGSSTTAFTAADLYQPQGDLGRAAVFVLQGRASTTLGQSEAVELFKRVGTDSTGAPIYEFMSHVNGRVTNRHWLRGPIRGFGLQVAGRCIIHDVEVLALP